MNYLMFKFAAGSGIYINNQTLLDKTSRNRYRLKEQLTAKLYSTLLYSPLDSKII